jgi:hypothetical protein
LATSPNISKLGHSQLQGSRAHHRLIVKPATVIARIRKGFPPVLELEDRARQARASGSLTYKIRPAELPNKTIILLLAELNDRYRSEPILKYRPQ